MPLKRTFFTVPLAVITVLAVFWAAGSISSQERPLVFAGAENFAPYSFVSNGEPTGYSVDLIKVLSATVNKDIHIVLLPWNECVSQLHSGGVTGLIGAPVETGHDHGMIYSSPVAELDFAIFVEATNNSVNSLASLEGTVVAIHKDCKALEEMKKHKRIRLLKVDSIPEALEKLNNREVTAAIAEKNVGLYYMQKAGFEGLKLVGPPVGTLTDYAIAVRKDEQALLKEIDLGLNMIRENGTLRRLQRKWLGLRLATPFPWKMVVFATSGITLLMLFLAAILWVISLNATVKAKTRQIHIMSQKMVEKDKLAVLGKLAGQIAHELRTPLSIINNSIFLLRKEGSENRELFEKRLRILEEKIKLSSNILESILSYSRIKAEMATTVSVKACLEETLKDMNIPAGVEKDVSFERPEKLMVFMDFHQLYSVFRNVILNALQVMGDTGKLTVKAFPSDDNMTVNVKICDTGGGIAEAIQNKIFNLFYSTKITGTGLGLPISKSIIEANEGELYLEESNEQGACFMIKLPSAKMLKK